MHNGWPSTLCLTAAILLTITAFGRLPRPVAVLGALGFAAAALLL